MGTSEEEDDEEVGDRALEGATGSGSSVEVGSVGGSVGGVVASVGGSTGGGGELS